MIVYAPHSNRTDTTFLNKFGNQLRNLNGVNQSPDVVALAIEAMSWEKFEEEGRHLLSKDDVSVAHIIDDIYSQFKSVLDSDMIPFYAEKKKVRHLVNAFKYIF